MGGVEAILKDLVDRAEEGQDGALETLREAVEIRADLLSHAVDLGQEAKTSWVELAVGGESTQVEAVQTQLEALRAELTGVEVSPLERILIDRVTLHGLKIWALEQEMARARRSGHPRGQVKRVERRHARVRRAYAAALKDLATLRRLFGPTDGDHASDPR